jgi:hypothetical protein
MSFRENGNPEEERSDGVTKELRLRDIQQSRISKKDINSFVLNQELESDKSLGKILDGISQKFMKNFKSRLQLIETKTQELLEKRTAYQIEQDDSSSNAARLGRKLNKKEIRTAIEALKKDVSLLYTTLNQQKLENESESFTELDREEWGEFNFEEKFELLLRWKGKLNNYLELVEGFTDKINELQEAVDMDSLDDQELTSTIVELDQIINSKQQDGNEQDLEEIVEKYSGQSFAACKVENYINYLENIEETLKEYENKTLLDKVEFDKLLYVLGNIRIVELNKNEDPQKEQVDTLKDLKMEVINSLFDGKMEKIIDTMLESEKILKIVQILNEAHNLGLVGEDFVNEIKERIINK